MDEEHLVDHSPEQEAVLDEEEGQVDLDGIVAALHLPVTEFGSWIEDKMIFIEYGQNLQKALPPKGQRLCLRRQIYIAAGTTM